MTTFSEWWEGAEGNWPSSVIEQSYIKDAAENAWLDGYEQALRRHGLLDGECNDLLDHYRIPGTGFCCKCGQDLSWTMFLETF